MLRIIQVTPSAKPDEYYSNNHRHVIEFLHPAYPDLRRQNVFLRLHATDHVSGRLHHSTAWLACAIVAGNAWTGFFSSTREPTRINVGRDELLTSSSYYFHVPCSQSNENDSIPYPICPSFRDWTFPHNDMPLGWESPAEEYATAPRRNINVAPPQSALSTAVLNRDDGCIITGSSDYITAAHLCPRGERDWFVDNDMAKYNIKADLTNPYIVDDVSNAISMRPDLHRAFDDRVFVLVPKSNLWVVHFLAPTLNLGSLYHNAEVAVSEGVSTSNLLTRFAWAVLPRMLLGGSGHRRLRLCVKKHGETTEVIEDMKVADYNAMANPTRSRSTSPRKRRTRELDETLENSLAMVASETKRRRLSDYPSISPSDLTPPHPTKRRRFDGTTHATPLETGHGSRSQKKSRSLSSACSTRAYEELAQSRSNDEKQSLEDQRQAWIKARRPSDASLYCCNYKTVEADIRAGRPGRGELDGAYLCAECLGFEFRDKKADLYDDQWDA